MSLSIVTQRWKDRARLSPIAVFPAPLAPVRTNSGSCTKRCRWPQYGQMAKGPCGSISFASLYSPHCGQTLNIPERGPLLRGAGLVRPPLQDGQAFVNRGAHLSDCLDATEHEQVEA